MRTASFFIYVVFVLSTTPAQAYLPPTTYLMQLLAQKHSHRIIRDLQIDLETELDDNGKPYVEHLYMKRPEKLRLTPTPGEHHAPTYIQTRTASATGSNGQLIRLPVANPRYLFATLLFPTGDDAENAALRMVEVLTTSGIDTSAVHLGRADDRPIYIIGAKPWETERPQLWLDKETLEPVRYVIRQGRPAFLEETRLSYDFSNDSVWFPSEFEIFEPDGTRIRRSSVARVRRNQKLPDTLFRLPSP